MSKLDEPEPQFARYPHRQLPPPVKGGFIKVCLPGETPWAECLEVHDDGSWIGRIDNKAKMAREFFGIGEFRFADHDNFCHNQVVKFSRSSDDEFDFWAPVSIQENNTDVYTSEEKP